MNNNNLTELNKGLYLDTSPHLQPKGTYRFALNTVIDTELGDIGFISNEESNSLCLTLEDRVIVGNCYISKDETAILSVSNDETISEIGILNTTNCEYTSYAKLNLGFTKADKFDVLFRLRRGCEKVIYFTNDKIRPMSFNFNKLDLYKDENGNFIKNKFYLQKSYTKLPMFRRLSVSENGQLKPGAYIFAIQYLDEDLNPTEYANISNRINIYQDKLTSNFSDINGSTAISTEYYSAQTTSKAITIDLYNLDTNYRFYRLAILKYNNITGQLSEATATDKIPINISSFVYDGTDYVRTTIEEVQQQNFIIDRAKNIAQLEEQLIFSNIKGKQTDYCSHQKYASKIKSRVVLKEQVLTTLNPGNPKFPGVDLLSIGYMPGEIYSFAIVYLYSDGTKSPAYHIPGIPSNANDMIPEGYKSMSTNNKLKSFTYDKRDNCTDYWGVDGWGNILEGTSVRHHRFPTRHEAGVDFIRDTTNTGIVEVGPQSNYITINYTADLEYNSYDPYDPYNQTGCSGQTDITIKYKLDGVEKTLTDNISTTDCRFFDSREYNLGEGTAVTDIIVNLSEPFKSNISEVYKNAGSNISFNGTNKATDIFGIEFYNIEKPESIGDVEIIGYEIVRQERTNQDKTIVDNGVLTPIIDNKNFATSAHIFPNMSTTEIKANSNYWNKTYFRMRNVLSSGTTRLNPNYRGLISPEFLFNSKEYPTAILKQVGNVTKDGVRYISEVVEDVQPGTSYDPDVNKKKEKDLDGFSLSTLSRINVVKHENTETKIYNPKNIFYLDAVSSFVNDSSDKEVFNVSSDNKTGIVEFDSQYSKPDADTNKLPYVVMYKDLPNPYGNYLSAKFHKQQLNPTLFNSSGSDKVSLYGGDSYMCPIKYTNTYFIDIHPRKRGKKSGLWKIITGALLTIASIVVTIATLGAALPITKMTVQYGLSMIAAGLKQEKLIRAYSDLWDKGLKETVQDADVASKFTFVNPADDEIQWMSDTIEDLWIETNFNIHLRLDAKDSGVSFIPPHRPITDEFMKKYIVNKLTVTDTDRAEGKLYKGFATAEFYKINQDYEIMNEGKYNYTLPYEYDCCSTCREEFPHRVVYSQKSFSEELTDNFKKFLPNNYKDISGETGPIVNMFVQQNRLYLHTSEALWMQPNTYQERVTNEIVSFLGTGSLLEAPAQRLLDDKTGNSAGLQHKWGAVQYTYGYAFICANEGTVYIFDGKLKPISNEGMNYWYKNNIISTKDTPSIGEGYIVGYDSYKQRLLFTRVNDSDNWTLSYSLKLNSWTSFHSYIPNGYIGLTNGFMSIKNNTIWKHNNSNHYQTFYGKLHPHIIEYISLSNSVTNKVWDYITLFTQTKEYNNINKGYVDIDLVTYNKAIFYNTNQCSGELTLIAKDKSQDYMMGYMDNYNLDETLIERVEKNWQINNFRDYRIDYSQPIWNNETKYNKTLNTASIDFNKNWTELESFRDKFLAVRLIFDKFADKKIITNFSVENETQSFH